MFPLFLVADGMGGHDRGDLASQTVASVMRDRLIGEQLPTTENAPEAIRAANDEVIALTSGEPGRGISGTTLAGVAFVVNEGQSSAHWMAFNVGDSRIYSWDGRTLEQLSVDHSAVQELVDAGTITNADARVHPDRNIVTRAVGARSHVDADVWLLSASGPKCFIICSDGLTKELDDRQIGRIITAHGILAKPASIADELVAASLTVGGRDNVSVVVVRVSSVETYDESEDTRGRIELLEETTPRLELRE